MGFKRQLGWTLAIIFSFISMISAQEDLPCMAREVNVPGRSIVCVCNANYCDTITRENPEPGTFVAYTSSNAGKRFFKSNGEIQNRTNNVDEDPDDSSTGDLEDNFEETSVRNVVLRMFQNRRYQYIEGFGGSVTDAAAINWRKLSERAQTNLIDTYFGPKGLEYNMIRVPIAGSDFSEHPYTYNELPWGDAALTNYSLTHEDLFLKLPMIARASRVATDEVKITASTWSPPIWMKTNEAITGFGQVRPQYYQSFANYHLKFLEEYAKANVKIWAITTSNEPLNGIIPLAPFNSIGWFPSQMARWVANNLGPTIRNSPFNDTKIFAVDDQRYMLHIYMLGMEREDPRALDYIDGIAIHYYGNLFPPAILSDLQRRYPNMQLLSTEASEGSMPWDLNKVEEGSWARARRYTQSILQDLNHYVTGWIDWNLCLSPTGGPNWASNFVDAPILVYEEQDEFIKNPMFYAMGHFSKWIPRGSRRVQLSRRSLATVQNLAVIKPDGNLIVVLQNTATDARNVRINLSASRFIEVLMDPESITTVEINQ